jgi:hypothetical protein
LYGAPHSLLGYARNMSDLLDTQSMCIDDPTNPSPGSIQGSWRNTGVSCKNFPSISRNSPLLMQAGRDDKPFLNWAILLEILASRVVVILRVDPGAWERPGHFSANIKEGRRDGISVGHLV